MNYFNPTLVRSEYVYAVVHPTGSVKARFFSKREARSMRDSRYKHCSILKRRISGEWENA